MDDAMVQPYARPVSDGGGGFHLPDISVLCVTSARGSVSMVGFVGTAGGDADGGCGRRLGCRWLESQIGK